MHRMNRIESHPFARRPLLRIAQACLLFGACTVIQLAVLGAARADEAAPPVAPPPVVEPAATPATLPHPAAVPVAPAAAPSATPPASPAVPEWVRNVSIGGGGILWYYQPFLEGAKNTVDLFFVNLLFDGQFDSFGLHIEPRFRDAKLRPHFGGQNGGTAWVQEVYASVKLPFEETLGGSTVLKVGKAYSHFGLFWDNSFYGNVQVYDGLKLDPDFGLSLEGAVAEAGSRGLRYWAQFFLIDGQTNVALDGRETFTIPGARRRNQAILRLEPFAQFGDAVVKLGLSGTVLQADLPDPVGKKTVVRGGADLTFKLKGLGLWAEFIRQNGQSVTAFPAVDAASSHNNYAQLGGEYTVGTLTARYNVSYGGYRDLSVSEWMHVPAVGVAVSPHITILGEYVYWKRTAAAGDTVLDKSLNVTLQAHY